MKHRLVEEDYTTEISCIGIVSSARIYRLAHFVNQTLNIQLKRQPDVQIDDKQNGRSISCFHYTGYDPMERVNYHLLAISSSTHPFFKALNKADYIMLFEGENHAEVSAKSKEELVGINLIELTFGVQAKQIKGLVNWVVD